MMWTYSASTISRIALNDVEIEALKSSWRLYEQYIGYNFTSSIEKCNMHVGSGLITEDTIFISISSRLIVIDSQLVV